MKTVLLLISILLSNLIISQNEYSNWNVGNRVWLRFPGPTYSPGSQLNTVEGCASISDPSTGMLLFYTDGVTVWDRTHTVMPNGTGLLGGNSSTQSAIILKQPGNTSLYYIFTVGQLFNSELCFHIVDMNANGGFGQVSVRNALIYVPTTEKLTATKHCNGIDWWILTHERETNVFRTMLLTATGISQYVSSTVGTTTNGVNNSSIGNMKVNQQGTRVAVAYYGLNRTCIYNFNNSTGVVSNEVNLPCNTGPYGLEFSPDGRLLYLGYNNNNNLHQYNLCNNNSRITVGSPGSFVGSLQLQNDGRIYVVSATQGGSKISVIMDPNNLGAACNFILNLSNTPFANQWFTFGLSQCFYDLDVFQYTYTPIINVNCLTATFNIPNICTSQPIVGVVWNFGDGNISTELTPTYTYNVANNYFGSVMINFNCNSLIVPFTLSTSVTNTTNVNNN